MPRYEYQLKDKTNDRLTVDICGGCDDKDNPETKALEIAETIHNDDSNFRGAKGAWCCAKSMVKDYQSHFEHASYEDAGAPYNCFDCGCVLTDNDY